MVIIGKTDINNSSVFILTQVKLFCGFKRIVLLSFFGLAPKMERIPYNKNLKQFS